MKHIKVGYGNLAAKVLLLAFLFFMLTAGMSGQPVRVACIGNSITYGDRIADRAHDSYPAQLQSLLGTGFEVRNFGNNGKCAQESSDDPYTKTREWSDAQAFLPNIVIIKLGTNDSKPQNWKSTKLFRKDLERIAATMAALPSHPRIIMALPAKAFSHAWGINDSIITAGVIPAVRQICKRHGWQLVDLHSLTEGMTTDFPDGIHPNPKGAGVIARAMRDAIADDMNRPQVLLQTDCGKIVVELFNETPLHRDNFLKQVKAGTFDGVLWHRVINKFLIQTGDRLSKNAQSGEMLGEGDETPADWIPAEVRAPLYYHQRGMLNAAREGDDTNPERKSSSTQFTIITGNTLDDAGLDRTQTRIDEWTHGTFKLTPEMRETYKTIGGAPHLDGSYTVFGRVVSGMEVVEAIEHTPTDRNDRPLQDVRIRKAKVIKRIKGVQK